MKQRKSVPLLSCQFQVVWPIAWFRISLLFKHPTGEIEIDINLYALIYHYVYDWQPQ
jgi:hypothetical protein